MKKIIFLYLLAIIPVVVYGQCSGSPSFPGVSQSNPIQVGNLNMSSQYTDTKNNSVSNCYGNNNLGQPSDDIWYRFTLLTNGEVYLSHCGSTFDTFMVLYNSNITMVAYNDNNETFCEGNAAGIKVTLPAGNYFLVSEGKGSASGDIRTTISLTPIVYSDPTGDIPYISKNYVTTYSPRQAYTATEALNSKTPSQVMKSTKYYDGLGRVLQTVQSKASPGLRDIVQPVVYNAYGREEVKYLPYVAPASQSDGLYKVLPIRDVKSFYNNPGGSEWNSPGVTSSMAPFSQSVYEYSPLGRLLAQGATGDDWQIGSGHETIMGYGINSSQEVIKFILDDNGMLQAPVYWGRSNLWVNAITNEEQIKSMTYMDKQYRDRIYLKRLENKDVMDAAGRSSSYWMDTYYVYNQKGELAFVLPPELIKQYIGYSNNGQVYLPFPLSAPSQELLDKLAYQYRYDNSGRLVAKHLPGKDWEFVVYNQKNLPVLTQDAKGRLLNQWLFTKYDIYGRAIANGIASILPQNLSGTTIFQKRDALQTVVDQYNLANQEYETATTATSLIPGYTNNSYPVNNLSLHTLTYFDTYQFLTSENFVLPLSNSLGGILSKNVRGMQTGSKVLVPGTSHWIVTIYGYNSKGQLIWDRKSNPYLSSTSVIEQRYNFTGETLQSKTTHSKSNNSTIVILDTFDYDHSGRMVKHVQCLNGDCTSRSVDGNHPNQELIAGNQYSELGQLLSKKVGNAIGKPLQTISFSYNIRGWLTSINNPENLGDELFGMKIGYNDLLTDASNANPNYNGNISSILWSGSNDNVKRMYGFKYDGVNRLKKADYSVSSVLSLVNFDEGIHPSTPAGIEYDYNGNILRLARNGLMGNNSYGLMDNLTYIYNGNQLSKVDDQVTAANTVNDQEFKDVNTVGNDYAYDVNGNMIMDLNKGLPNGGILYNHLNLPTEITKANQKIKYIYDANGQKLEKQFIVDGILQTSTQYVDGFVYKKNVFEYFTHAEGYVRKENNGAYTYVFQYKDHLGNVRLSYADSNNDAAIYTSTTPIFYDGFETSSGWDSIGAMWGAAISSYDLNFKKSGNVSGKIEKPTALELYVHNNAWVPINNTVDTEYIFSGWVYSDNPTVDILMVGKTATETEYNSVAYAASTSVKNRWVYLEKRVTVPANIKTLNMRVDNNGGGNVWFDDISIRKVNLAGASEIVEVNSYYPFGLEHKLNNFSTSSNYGQKYKYNGKELQDELGLNVYDYGARNYDPALGRWMNIDPMAEQRQWLSPYNYVQNNPILKIDPDGMLDGDFYTDTGKYLGNDGIDDDKLYVTTQQTVESNTTNAKTDWSDVKSSDNTVNLTEKTGIKHSEFLQMAAAVYNETFGSELKPKEQLTSAIKNRFGREGFGSDTWQKTIDRLAYWNDSHEQRMSPERANPAPGAKTPNGKVLLSNIREENYQNFINTTPNGRSANPQMKMSIQASIYTLNGGKDLVNGAYQWRGNGVINIFFKKTKGDTTY